MTGGISQHAINATPEIQDIVSKIKPELETKLGKTFGVFQAINYKKQLVNGMNYFVKVKTDNGYDHLRIFVPFSQEGAPPKLYSVQQNKTLEDEITYF